MNSINFFSGDKFPLYREALDKMQNMIHLVSALAGMGGTNFILSGCEENNGNVSAGVIVINNEIMPFAGGIKKEKITVVESRQDVTGFNIVYPETYINRVAQFSDTGAYNWSDFEPVKTNAELYNRIMDITGDAPGTVKMWSGQVVKIPSDYKLCDGSLLPVNEYPKLFENLGTSFGGDGINSFALPNIKGRFVVGYDDGNPDYNAIRNDKIGGLKEITLTPGQLPAHDHTSPGNTPFVRLSARAGDVDATNTPGSTDSTGAEREYRVGGMSDLQWQDARIKSVGLNEAHENRPPYFVLAYIIKVR